jgi:hypothetical protein
VASTSHKRSKPGPTTVAAGCGQRGKQQHLRPLSRALTCALALATPPPPPRPARRAHGPTCPRRAVWAAGCCPGTYQRSALCSPAAAASPSGPARRPPSRRQLRRARRACEGGGGGEGTRGRAPGLAWGGRARLHLPARPWRGTGTAVLARRRRARLARAGCCEAAAAARGLRSARALACASPVAGVLGPYNRPGALLRV